MKLKRLIALIIPLMCIITIACLTGAVVNKAISFGWYIFWISVAGVVFWLDTIYLDKQFNNGEWV